MSSSASLPPIAQNGQWASTERVTPAIQRISPHLIPTNAVPCVHAPISFLYEYKSSSCYGALFAPRQSSKEESVAQALPMKRPFSIGWNRLGTESDRASFHQAEGRSIV
jgi:hypothetical protein